MASIERKYQFAVIATDVVIFTVKDGFLEVLLIEMKKKPYMGRWALPGGLVHPREPLDVAALRHLVLKTGIKSTYLEQLYTFGKVDRDPFGRVVSVAYMALMPGQNLKLHTTREYADVAWFPVEHLPKLAYDHREIIHYAVTRLKSKLGYSNIVHSLLPDEFTFGDLQKIYEVILRKRLDKRNFRKKIRSLKFVRAVGRKKVGAAHRPAELFAFVNRKLALIDIL